MHTNGPASAEYKSVDDRRFPGSAKTVKLTGLNLVQGAVTSQTSRIEIEFLSAFSVKEEPSYEISVPKWKRGLDIVVVIAGLPIWMILSVFIVVWIKTVSSGPVFFRQSRVGLGERQFTIYKFRSMKNGIECQSHEQHIQKLLENDIPIIKLDALGDPRVIKGGRFLRSTGLDELPQLLNVLRGEMSFVGPRPCLPQEYNLFTIEQRKRFQVLPGLTGLWQINKNYPMTFKEMNLMDVDYARKSSLWMDLVIMVKTPKAIIRQIFEYVKIWKNSRSKGWIPSRKFL